MAKQFYFKRADGTVGAVENVPYMVESLGVQQGNWQPITKDEYSNILKTQGQKIIQEKGISDPNVIELLTTKPTGQFSVADKKLYMAALGMNPDEAGVTNIYSLPQNTGLDLTSAAAQNVPQYGTSKPTPTTTSSNETGGYSAMASGAQGLSPQIMAIIKGRSDLLELYDVNTGQAKNVNDPRVKGIPTLTDWWNSYGKKEYPYVPVGGEEGTGTAGAETGAVDTTQSTADAIKEFKERGVSAGWPQELIDLGVAAIELFPKDQQVSADEIINTFNKIKSETIDPYFKELADIAIKDFTFAKQNLETNRALELEQERAAAGQDIRQAKEGLEKAGMTFTGKAIETLGKESAYPQADVTPTPTQTPFGGMFYEGTVPQASRLIATSNLARYQANAQELGRKAETALGTTGAAGIGIAYTPAGVGQTGTLLSQQQQKYAATLQDLIEQQKAKKALTTQNLNKN